MLHNVVLHTVVLHTAVLHTVVLYSPVMYSSVLHSVTYHSQATFTELTFVNVHHAHMSTFVIEVCLSRFCLSDQLVTVLLRSIENTGCGIMSVSDTPNQALQRTLFMLNSGL